ncbi:Spo11/DNA topoisomerase VI subunit A [Pholiota molesta]|nr:Spo11/DNA topoisomerase VI subunit A [Pholiota molesta]
MVLLFLRQLATPGSSNNRNESSEEYAADTPLTRSNYKIEIPLVDRKRADAEGISSMKMLRYPKKSSSGSARVFAQLFKVLDLAHEATLSGVPATKRDIYYRDVSLFQRQSVVDSLVDDLAATFQLERSDLNIRSSSKGVVCGSGLTITLLSGEIMHCNDAEGTLIPAGEDIQSFSIDEEVAWVLVVEKEVILSYIDGMLTTAIMYFRLYSRRYAVFSYARITPYLDQESLSQAKDIQSCNRHLVKSLADALPKMSCATKIKYPASWIC